MINVDYNGINIKTCMDLYMVNINSVCDADSKEIKFEEN